MRPNDKNFAQHHWEEVRRLLVVELHDILLVKPPYDNATRQDRIFMYQLLDQIYDRHKLFSAVQSLGESKRWKEQVLRIEQDLLHSDKFRNTFTTFLKAIGDFARVSSKLNRPLIIFISIIKDGITTQYSLG